MISLTHFAFQALVTFASMGSTPPQSHGDSMNNSTKACCMRQAVPTMAATIIREAGLGQADCSGLDDFDKNHLRKIQGESGIALRGL